MTQDEARTKFRESGLTYNDCFDNYTQLIIYLQEELDLHTAKGDMPMTISKRFDYFLKPRSRNVEKFYIFVNGSYFSDREAISFNPDGFIGFAGWSSSDNLQPFVVGFSKFIDFLKEKKCL